MVLSAAKQLQPTMMTLLFLFSSIVVSSSFSIRSKNAILVPSDQLKCRGIPRSRYATPLHRDESDHTSSTNPPSTSTPPNLYEILGASPSMPKTEIKRLYLTLARETHPDSSSFNPSSPSFTDIAQAYATLSDDRLRRRYDRILAAEEFKEDVVNIAGKVAKEYGPAANQFYEDWALPFLRRTTAGTVAGLRVVGEVTRGKFENGVALQEERNGNSALDGLGRAFQRVIDAGRNATRKVDGMELKEKSLELQKRADEASEESLIIREHLFAVKSERLRLTFLTPSANFSSSEALDYLDEFNLNERISLISRLSITNAIRQDIETFRYAELEFERRSQEKNRLEAQALSLVKDLEDARQAMESTPLPVEQGDSQGTKMLQEAQRRIRDCQSRASETHRALNRTITFLVRAEQEFKSRRDIVRRALIKMEDKDGVSKSNLSYSGESERIDLNSIDFKSLSMTDPGLEEKSLNMIEKLRYQETRIEADLTRSVEKAGRMVSRSERLRLRSEELVGNQYGNAGSMRRVATSVVEEAMR